MIKTDFFDEHPVAKHLLMMLAVSIGIIMIIFMFLRVYARHGRVCEMPEITGLNITEAIDNNPNNLRYVVIDSVYQEGDAGGTILMQDPKAGTQIKPGRKVYVTITSYVAEAMTMPHVSNTASIAISTLENAGLLGKLYFRIDESMAGAVLTRTYKGYEVQEGEKLDPGAHIDLTIAMRSNDAKVMPFLVGKNAIQAHRELHKNMLNVGREHFDGVTERAKAIVVRTEPGYNGVNRLPYGTEIEIWYQSSDRVDANQIAREFKVDSSQIVREEPDSYSSSTDDYLADQESHSGIIEW